MAGFDCWVSTLFSVCAEFQAGRRDRFLDGIYEEIANGGKPEKNREMYAIAG